MSSKETLMWDVLKHAVIEAEMSDSSGTWNSNHKKRFILIPLLTSDSEIDEIMDDAVDALTMISSKRYCFRSNVPKYLSWFDETVPQYDDKRFKMLFRCTRQQFKTILDLIKDNPVFHGKNSEKQFSLYFQLALVMYRLGSFGTGAEIGKIAALFGIGDGGTIDKITWRVFKCILQLENEYMNWPSAEERMDIILENWDELPHCVGFTDGIEFKVLYKPADDHVSLYSRKKQYSIKMQGTFHFNEMLRHWDMLSLGGPEVCMTAEYSHESRMSTHPDEFFLGDGIFESRFCVYLDGESHNAFSFQLF